MVWTAPDAETQCIINRSEPHYQPNVYMCYNGSNCCFFRGEPTCCSGDLSFSQFWNQLYPFLIGVFFILFVFWFIEWLFEEDNIEEEEHSFYPMDVKKYKGYMIKDEFDSMVDDPVFGPCYALSVSRLAGGTDQKHQ